METSTLVKEKRKALGLTQQQLADILGKERSSISRYETGDADPPGSVILKLQSMKTRGRRKPKEKEIVWTSK